MGERPGRGNLTSQILRSSLLAISVVLLALVAASCASHTATVARRGGIARSAPAAHPTPTSPPTSLPATTVRRFTPLDAAGRLRVPVGHAARGSCFSASAADPVAHAYRCLAGNELLDPCFADPRDRTPSTVSCVNDPWSDAVVVTLTAKLPPAEPLAHGARPWALQLDTGLRCTASTGTVPFVHDVALGFRCSGGRYAAVVDPLAAIVVAQYALPNGTVLQRARVSIMWRG